MSPPLPTPTAGVAPFLVESGEPVVKGGGEVVGVVGGFTVDVVVLIGVDGPFVEGTTPPLPPPTAGVVPGLGDDGKMDVDEELDDGVARLPLPTPATAAAAGLWIAGSMLAANVGIAAADGATGDGTG